MNIDSPSFGGTAMDNIMFVMDASNGKVLTGKSRNGARGTVSLETYGDEMCLVTDNFRWYRESDWRHGMEPMNDGITCWRGAKKLWHLDLPPDAQLVMSGKRILAVTKSKQAIYVNEIEPPRMKSE